MRIKEVYMIFWKTVIFKAKLSYILQSERNFPLVPNCK